MWWSELIPKAMKKWNPRSPDEAKMREILTAAGFTKIRCEPLLEEFLYDPELYLNPENFLDIENFRRSDSTFNLVTDEELQAAVARVYNMQMQGTLQAWFQQREQARLARANGHGLRGKDGSGGTAVSGRRGRRGLLNGAERTV